MPRRSRRWAWAGRAVFGLVVAGLVGYLVEVGLAKADMVASSISAILALLALGAPYLLPSSPSRDAPVPDPNRVEDTGRANATGGGRANTGLLASNGDRPAQVARSGNATADGPGSVANTGIQHEPRS
jgi:hypothetical protein